MERPRSTHHSTTHQCEWTRFRIGEISVSVSSDSGRVLDDFSALYDGFQSHRARDERDIHMRVAAGSKNPLSRARHHVFGDGEELFTGRRRAELLPYLEWGVNWRVIARREDFLQVHAAVLSRGSGAALFVGDSGVGKSTLAAGLIARGWRYLSDEFALIHPGTLRVHAFPKALCVKQGSFKTVAGLGFPIWRRGHYVKAFKGPVGYVRIADISSQVELGSLPVRCVVFPHYACGQEPRIRPIPRASAAFLLAGHSFNRNFFGDRTIPILSRVVRGARCVRLDSSDLERTCNLIESELFETCCADEVESVSVNRNLPPLRIGCVEPRGANAAGSVAP